MIVGTRSLSCQKCGGVLKCVDNHNAYRCEYCHSICVVSDAPLLVDGIQPVNDAVNAPCPACSESMQTAQLDGRPILYCQGCFGMLIRREHFGAIVSERRSKRAGLEQEQPRPIDPSVYSRRLRCPSCECQMETHPYYGPGNVVIDSCSECGYVWLDHGELSRVERSIGGREFSSISPLLNFSGYADSGPANNKDDRHPIAILADFLF